MMFLSQYRYGRELYPINGYEAIQLKYDLMNMAQSQGSFHHFMYDTKRIRCKKYYLERFKEKDGKRTRKVNKVNTSLSEPFRIGDRLLIGGKLREIIHANSVAEIEIPDMEDNSQMKVFEDHPDPKCKELLKRLSPMIDQASSVKGFSNNPLSVYYPNLKDEKLFMNSDVVHAIRDNPLRPFDDFLSELQGKDVIEPVEPELLEKEDARGVFTPIFLATGGKKPRYVVDMKKPNESIENYNPGYANLQEITGSIQSGEANVLSTIDLESAFYSCRYLSYDEWTKSNPTQNLSRLYCYFYFPYKGKKYRWTAMPMGVADAPAHFTRLGNSLFEGMKGVHNYVDDFLLNTGETDTHYELLNEVLEIIIKNNLKISKEKCKFFQKKLRYLGCIFSQEGIGADPEKIESILDYKTPTTVRGLRSYLGAITYNSQFVVERATLLSKLTNILKGKQKKDRLSAEEQKIVKEEMNKINAAFNDLVSKSFPSPDDDLHVFTDASDAGIAGVLGFFDKNGKLRVVDLFSKSLSESAKKYTTFKKETLAVLSSLLNWEKLLKLKTFAIHTDNKSLVQGLANPSKLSKMENRWISIINEFQYVSFHIPGIENTLADTLSREPSKVLTKNRLMSIRPVTYNISQPILKTPSSQEEKDEMVDDAHTSDHAGAYIMIQRIRENGWDWDDLQLDCKHRVNRCTECMRYNSTKRHFHLPSSVTASSPFQHVIMDLATGVNGEKYVLVYVDAFTSYVVFEPLPDKSKETMVQVIAELFCTYGCPRIVQSDGGGEFKSEYLQELIRTITAEYRFSPAYVPRVNGKAEVKVGAFKHTLAKLMGKRSASTHKNWPLFLKYIQYMLNSRVAKRRGYNPFNLVYGHAAAGVMSGMFKNYPLINFNVQDWFQSQNHLWNVIYDEIEENRMKYFIQERAAFARHHIIDEKLLDIGTRVMVANPMKFQNLWTQKWSGPYVIHSIDAKKHYKLKMNDDPETNVLSRVFTRDNLKVVSPELPFSDPEIIVAVHDVSYDDEPGSSDNNIYYLVEYLDPEMDKTWLQADLMPTEIIEMIPDGSQFPLRFSKMALKNIYNLQDADLQTLTNNPE